MNEPQDGQSIVSNELVQQRFGSSLDVIDIMEPIEAAWSYRLGTGSTEQGICSGPWPVWNLFARCKGKPLSETIPVYSKDFDAWVATLS